MRAALSVPIRLSETTADLTELVTRHQGQVLGAALSVVGDRARAEELAQETFLVAWAKLESGAHIDNRAAWLCGIARNLARNARRRDGRALRVDPEPVPSALDSLVEHERRGEVWRALDAVPDRYREPLVLFYVGGESVAEVAEALSLSEPTVRQRLTRGRDQVRARLEAVERELRGRRPGPAFTALVLAAWAARGKDAMAALGGGKLGASLATPLAATLIGALVVAGGVVVRTRKHAAQPSPQEARAATARRDRPPARVSPPFPTLPAPAVVPTPKVAHDRERIPDGLARTVDIDLNGFRASAAFNIIGEATEVPIVVADDEEIDMTVNVKEKNATALTMLDEVLAQTARERHDAEIVTIARGVGTIELPDKGPMDLSADGVLLDAVVHEVSAHIGEPIFLPGSVAKKVVHLSLHGVSATTALQALVGPLGFGWERRAGFVITPEAP